MQIEALAAARGPLFCEMLRRALKLRRDDARHGSDPPDELIALDDGAPAILTGEKFLVLYGFVHAGPRTT